MELKSYQKRVIAELTDYLDQLNKQPTLTRAFAAYWESRQIPVGGNGIAGYQNIVDGVPHVCFKVPTGGGKTLLGCASLKPIFAALPPMRYRAVVWLVPSDAILSQTLAALKDPFHPYRQRLNGDFAGRVEVYAKDELLSGQNFSPATVAEQLSVMVLSYDSFRANRKEGRKAYQANGNLAPFATAFGAPEQPIENTDETALFQVINQLNPVIVVDESHHATTTLSHEMLVNFNPAFILDLTATPHRQSNIISYVDALALKNAHMVKLPVIAYNRASQTEVITDAIDLRQSLENQANQQRQQGGDYIRPIVLFQAQPKTGEDATSFERLREKLVDAGIPAQQIAIKTASINELKNQDLLSPDCEIRYIITVNALKEGWDCSFAYILASLANKTSKVDVEQILGRVLRQPHATQQHSPLLNMSYVLTSSNDFNDTLNQIIVGLNNAGFSKRDFRAAEPIQPDIIAPAAATEPPPGTTSQPAESHTEEFLDFDETAVAAGLEQRGAADNLSPAPASTSPVLATMLEQAQVQGAGYEEQARQAARLGGDWVPADLEAAVTTAKMYAKYALELSGFRLPQFVIKTPPSELFPTTEDGMDLLQHEHLAANFVLRGKDTQLDLSSADEQMYRLDVARDNADVPKAFRVKAADQRRLREYFGKLDVDSRKRTAAAAIYQRLRQINAINDAELRSYINQITENFNAEDLRTYQEHPNAVAEKIRTKINALLERHKTERFYRDIETRDISIRPTYALPPAIQPIHPTAVFGGSLYEAEESMNNDEEGFAGRFSSMENIRWWHRNIERKGFCINGPFNHYPDFIVMTNNGTVVMVEPKGEQLKNDDSRRKLKLGREWAALAGDGFRYYMVFQDGVTPLEGAVSKSDFFQILEQL